MRLFIALTRYRWYRREYPAALRHEVWRHAWKWAA